MDYYICIPAFETDMKKSIQNEQFLNLYNIQKNKGMILIPENCSDEEIEEYRRQISDKAREYELYFDLATLQTNILIE